MPMATGVQTVAALSMAVDASGPDLPHSEDDQDGGNGGGVGGSGSVHRDSGNSDADKIGSHLPSIRVVTAINDSRSSSSNGGSEDGSGTALDGITRALRSQDPASASLTATGREPESTSGRSDLDLEEQDHEHSAASSTTEDDDGASADSDESSTNGTDAEEPDAEDLGLSSSPGGGGGAAAAPGAEGSLAPPPTQADRSGDGGDGRDEGAHLCFDVRFASSQLHISKPAVEAAFPELYRAFASSKHFIRKNRGCARSGLTPTDAPPRADVVLDFVAAEDGQLHSQGCTLILVYGEFKMNGVHGLLSSMKAGRCRWLQLVVEPGRNPQLERLTEMEHQEAELRHGRRAVRRQGAKAAAVQRRPGLDSTPASRNAAGAGAGRDTETYGHSSSSDDGRSDSGSTSQGDSDGGADVGAPAQRKRQPTERRRKHSGQLTGQHQQQHQQQKLSAAAAAAQPPVDGHILRQGRHLRRFWGTDAIRACFPKEASAALRTHSIQPVVLHTLVRAGRLQAHEPGQVRVCGLTFDAALAPAVASTQAAWLAWLGRELRYADPARVQVSLAAANAGEQLNRNLVSSRLARLLGLEGAWDASLPEDPVVLEGALAPCGDPTRGGAGLQAAEAIKKNTVLGVVGGYVMPAAAAKDFVNFGHKHCWPEVAARLAEVVEGTQADVAAAWGLLAGSFRMPLAAGLGVREGPGLPAAVELSMLGYGNLTALVNDPRVDPRDWHAGNDVDAQEAAAKANCAASNGAWSGIDVICLPHVVPVSVRGLVLPVLVALRDIAPGEQLLRDYGADWWRELADAWEVAEHDGLDVARLLRPEPEP
ncbi:hypothetical protein GPECTOR_30g178 [Gonium pectorale]|uniref:SET domain-containing protein n=1 Tax=Gonium pectorale TaxID=33097 RepID=A0A150GE77_GONPE|nr:hypothetical protein GPECTOR_30g178 [Gonium pectorale]|eukprot:KXZ48083.1 hypothetical protein GPECTOR_30g178 [Gonium pectorale]